MESSRFFVANLPTNTKEEDISYLFKDYGQIANIELKNKQNLVNPDDVQIIAFVTLNIGGRHAENCLNDLNRQIVHGHKIRASFAKESFLERLKREREEENAVNNAATEQPLKFNSNLLKAPRENKRKTFDVDAELGDDEVAPELMISKKRAASSIYNGKIVIQDFGVQPIHVIEPKYKNKKLLDIKTISSDQKRKLSLKKMQNQYQQNKVAIQQALQGMDKTSTNKIKFSDAESDQEEKIKKSKTDIFGTDEDSDGDKVTFKSVTLGKKGEKLVQMQSEQSLDPRFRIDAKFVDDDNDEDDKDEIEDNERQWQMNMLEQVVGTKLDAVKNPNKPQKKKMQRYDPSKDEHQKFERSKQNTQIEKPKHAGGNENNKLHSVPAEVSKELFYVVTDTLQQSLRTRGEGFSLLNMFGRTEHLEQRDEKLKQLENEKILVNNKLEKSFAIDTFGYDSSSESESGLNEQENFCGKTSDKTKLDSLKKSNKKLKIATESFFITKNDIRLKEGAKFFIYKKNEAEAVNENYEEVRKRLNLLIKTKITKTKKNMVNAGYKGKRKV